jgi:aryl-alcohol dehydrogenase-like predicted oxidoreductase
LRVWLAEACGKHNSAAHTHPQLDHALSRGINFIDMAVLNVHDER